MSSSEQLAEGGLGAGEGVGSRDSKSDPEQPQINESALSEEALSNMIVSIATNLSRLNENMAVLGQGLAQQRSERIAGTGPLAAGSGLMGISASPHVQTVGSWSFPSLSLEEKQGCCAREGEFHEFLASKMKTLTGEKALEYLRLRTQFYAVANMSDFSYARAVFEVNGPNSVAPDVLARLRQCGWTGTTSASPSGMKSQASSGGSPGSASLGACYICGEKGHWARKCPLKKRSTTTITTTNTTNGDPAPLAGGEQ